MDAPDPDGGLRPAASIALVLLYLATAAAPFAALIWGMYASLVWRWEGTAVAIPALVILFAPPVASVALTSYYRRTGTPGWSTAGAALGVVVWLGAVCFFLGP